ncbi:MAG: proprotein convertase P-domain-containing protein [Phycisphaerales bacterium]
MSRMMRAGAVLAIAFGGSAAANASLYVGAGGSLVDASDLPGVASFTINVGDAGTVGAINGITLSNLSHTWVGDVQITLTLPDATTVSLVNRIGYTGSLFGDSSNYLGTYAFADGGANLWEIATDPGHGNTYNIASGTYAASGAGSGTPINLNALLVGKSIAGAWTLTITDYESGDTGSLGGWTLDVAVVPGPGGACALALGCAMGHRRRRR